jgi:hypothetical protein
MNLGKSSKSRGLLSLMYCATAANSEVRLFHLIFPPSSASRAVTMFCHTPPLPIWKEVEQGQGEQRSPMAARFGGVWDEEGDDETRGGGRLVLAAAVLAAGLLRPLVERTSERLVIGG